MAADVQPIQRLHAGDVNRNRRRRLHIGAGADQRRVLVEDLRRRGDHLDAVDEGEGARRRLERDIDGRRRVPRRREKVFLDDVGLGERLRREEGAEVAEQRDGAGGDGEI